MANVRFSEELSLPVLVVGHYTPETPARGMMGPPGDSEPGEPEDVELEAVVLTVEGKDVDLLPLLGENERRYLRGRIADEAREQMESAELERQIDREEARRDYEEDR